MFYQFWIIMSSSPPSLVAPLLIPPPYPLSPHPSSSSPSLLTPLLTPPPHPPLLSPSSSPLFSPLLLTPSLLTSLLTPPSHPRLSPSSSPLLLTPSLLTPPPRPGQLQVLWFLTVWTKTLLENKTLYSYQLHVLSILDYNELICHF